MERSYRQIFVGNYSFSLFSIKQIIKTIINIDILSSPWPQYLNNTVYNFITLKNNRFFPEIKLSKTIVFFSSLSQRQHTTLFPIWCLVKADKMVI